MNATSTFEALKPFVCKVNGDSRLDRVVSTMGCVVACDGRCMAVANYGKLDESKPTIDMATGESVEYVKWTKVLPRDTRPLFSLPTAMLLGAVEAFEAVAKIATKNWQSSAMIFDAGSDLRIRQDPCVSEIVMSVPAIQSSAICGATVMPNIAEHCIVAFSPVYLRKVAKLFKACPSVMFEWQGEASKPFVIHGGCPEALLAVLAPVNVRDGGSQ